MSIKRMVLAAVVMLTLVGGAITVGAPSASAATPQCGPHCIQIFSRKFGTPAHPRFVETVFHGVAKVGQPTILHRPSSSNPAGDLIAMAPGAGLVSDFFKAGLVSAAVNQHYGTERAAQLQYAPLGKPTGLCAALATTAFQNEGLILQPCSTPGTTVWIIDTADSPATAPTYFPLVNGSTTDFTHPFAMTIHGNPAHKRFPQIKVQRLRGNPAHVRDSQLWGANVSN
ncbi:MAG TPA: hypothetical protein VF506_15530 [Streptosporangiaceae bacterium]